MYNAKPAGFAQWHERPSDWHGRCKVLHPVTSLVVNNQT